MVQTNVSLSDVAFIMPKSGQHKSATAVIPPNATCDLRFAAKLKSSSVVLKVRMKLQGGDESLKQPIFNIYIYQDHSYVLRLKYRLSTTLKVSEGHLMNLSYINCRSYTWGTLRAQVRCLLGKPCNSFVKYITLLFEFLKKSHKLRKLTKPTSANCFQPDTAAFVVHPDQRPRARHSGVMPLMFPSQAPAESGHLWQWQRCKVRKVLAAIN